MSSPLARTLLLTVALSRLAPALPQGAEVRNGTVQITPGANILQILQSSPQAIINWNSFNISPTELVQFLQPGASAVVLNRVTGLDPSLLQGTLQANGRVFLVNPNGILFGANASIDVGSFMATTLQLTDSDFLSGNYNLTQDPNLPLRALVNQGSIHVSDGGFVVLVAPMLHNEGMIVAHAGQVQLGAGQKATFSTDGQGLLNFVLDDGFRGANPGQAAEGTVLLTPGQMTQVLGQVVGASGPPEAVSLTQPKLGGVLVNTGTVNVDSTSSRPAGTIGINSSQASLLGGTLSASAVGAQDAGSLLAFSAGRTSSVGKLLATAESGKGGFTEVSGKSVELHGRVDLRSASGVSGELLIDPNNVTIVDGPDQSGTADNDLPDLTGAQAGSDVTVSTGSFANRTNTVKIQADNDISYTGSGFSTTADLILQAGRDITLSNPSGSLSIQANSFTATSGRNTSISARDNLQISTQFPGSGGISLMSQDELGLSGTTGSLTLTASNGVDLQANGNLTTSDGGGGTTFSTGAGGLQVNGGVVNLQSQGFLGVGGRGAHSIHSDSDLTIAATNGIGVDSLNQSVALSANNALSLTATAAATAGISLTSAGGVALSSGTATNVYASNGVNLQTSGDLTSSSGADSVFSGGTAGVQLAGGRVDLQSQGSFQLAASGVSGIRSNADLKVSAQSGIDLTTLQGLSVTANGGARLETQTGDFLVRGSDVTLRAGQTTPASNLELFSGNSISVSGQTFQGSASGQINFEAVNGTLNVQALGDLGMTSGGLILLQGSNGGGLNLEGGRLSLVSGDTILLSNRGPVTVRSGGELTLSAQQALQLQSDTQSVQVSANGDLTMQSATALIAALAPQGSVSLTSGGRLSATAQETLNLSGQLGNQLSARDVSLTSRYVYSGASALNIQGDRSVTLQSSQGNALNVTAGSLQVRAGTGDVNLGSDSTELANVSSENGNLSISAGGAIRAQVPGALQVVARGGNAVLNAAGDLTLTAATSLSLAATDILQITSSNAAVNLMAGAVSLSSANSSGLIGANTGVSVVATTGDTSLRAATGLGIEASSGSVRISSLRDTVIDGSTNVGIAASQGALNLSGARTLTVRGEQIVGLQGQQGANLSGGNVTVDSRNVYADTNPLTIRGDQNVTLQNGQTGAVNVTAGSTEIHASAGSLTIGAASSGGSNVNAQSGDLILSSAEDLNLSGANLQAGSGSVRASAGGTLSVNQAQARHNLDFSGNNVRLSSVGSLTAGNLTVKASNDLIELNATSPEAAPQVFETVSLDAAHIYGVGGSNGFTIPRTSGQVNVHVTGGNVTDLGLAGSLNQLNGPGGPQVQLQTENTTGDIYIDGVLQGRKPPVKGQELPPSFTPASGLTAIQRAEILQSLAQDNVSLGNLPSSPAQNDGALGVTVSEALGHAANRNSVESALSVVVDPSDQAGWDDELLATEALVASMDSELKEKDRAAYNAMVDQEVREIWEVRYWRRLLEGFVLWEE